MNFLFKLFGGSYDDLWKAIIRPNRDTYTQNELGPYKFELREKCYKRTDFELINKRSQKLMCSFWEPFDEERIKPRLPCVIYLHGNSSSRVEAYPEVQYLLQRNITVFAFDFCGCGKSEGEYISLGYYEKKDVHCVIEYLLKSKKVSKIGLWGRSMGAVTAIMYANEHPALIDAMVLDSGFYSLKQLIHELIESKVNLPNFIFEKVLSMVKETIREKANFDLDIIEPYIYAKNCLVPALFCHGSDDKFVFPHHCVDLFNDYKSKDKFCEIVKGSHNTSRPKSLRIKACDFLEKYLKDDDLQSSRTINNSNTYERIIINNNMYKNNIKNINIYRNNNANNNLDKIKIKKKTKTKENINIKIKNNFNNYANRGSTDELNALNNSPTKKITNASQNMRTYSQNKYSKNDLKIVNIKNTKNHNKSSINLIKNIKIKSTNIIKLKNEENVSISSSSNIEEEVPVYRKKKIKRDIINPLKINSISVSHHFFSKCNSNNNSNKDPNINIDVNKSSVINKNISVTNLNQSKKQLNPLNINNISNSFLHNVITNNSNFKNSKNVNPGGKTYTDNFYAINPNNENTKIIQNNFYTTNNIFFNRYKEMNPKQSQPILNFSYTSKKPIDKYQFNNKNKVKIVEKNDFKKNLLFKSVDLKKEENNKPNVKNNLNVINNINNQNIQNNQNIRTSQTKKINSKGTIHSTDNTYLDENEEVLGRNLPH